MYNNRDVIFDKKAMLHSKNESVALNKHHDIDKQMELEAKPSVHPLEGDIAIQPVQDDELEITDERDASREQQYIIVTDRSRRQIRPIQRYKYANLLSFPLSMIGRFKIPRFL